jgi:ferredoxin-NADP reductase/CRP-like cAMP-binding protein
MDTTSFALLRSGLFSGLADTAFVDLVREATSVEVREGEILVREGDPADAFYVVLSGRLQVYTQAAAGQLVMLTQLDPGQHFGEQALLTETGRRSANVRGLAPISTVARLAREHLSVSLASSPELEQGLRRLGQRQQDERLSRRTSLVRELLTGSSFGVKERTWPNGQVLYREGEPTGPVYVVLSGHIELYTERDGASVRVARVGPGLCAGERDETVRAVTAIVDGDSRLLEVSREELAHRAASSPELRHHLSALERVWELPQRGYVTQYAGDLEGQPCLTQMFHLRGGRRVVSTHIVGEEQVRLESSPGEAARWIATPDGQVRVGVESDGRVWGVEAKSTQPVLAALFSRAIAGEALTLLEETELARTGQLTREVEAMLCACLRITRATVQAAIRNGLVDVAAIQQRTGCGTSCGSCVPAVVELLGEAAFWPVSAANVVELTPDVRKLVIVPVGAPLPHARPGQHIVVRVTTPSRTIERPYTLSGAAGGPWEITVKREEGGAFSSWLFEEARTGVRFEASTPMGSYTFDEGPAPVICFVSGIGVTPALSFARTLLRKGLPHRLVIDWSTRSERDTAILGELASANAPNLTIKTRITSRSGRLRSDETHALAARFPTAVFYLCGSEGFMNDVATWLESAGVAKERTRIEHFNREALA